MRRVLAVVFAVALLLFLPSVRYGFVQDDRAIIALNPAVHSIPAALAALDQPYWPKPSHAGLYRPFTILTYAVDWTVSGGAPGWFHLMNALWHALVAVLVTLVLARWLPPLGAAAAGLLFAVHPVHVEGVASLVSRAELLAAAGMLAAVLAARRGRWWAAVLCALLAMFSKEHGVVTGVLILVDDWLQHDGRPRYPLSFYAVMAVATLGYLAIWLQVGREGAADIAPAFYGVGTSGRLAMALPAILRAARLLVWPVNLSADYGPQVIPFRTTLSLAALGGVLVVLAVPTLILWCRRRSPGITFGAAVALLTYLPTANLLFPSGVLLAERNLYTGVLLVAAIGGAGAVWLAERWDARRAWLVAGVVVAALATRSLVRLPLWRHNKDFLLTTLREHPESYRAHQWAATVLAGILDTAGARHEYALADSLFDRDPHLEAARAFYLLGLGDTSTAAPLVSRVRAIMPGEPFALRAQFLLLQRRGDGRGAQALADSVRRIAPADAPWYAQRLRL